MVFLIPASINHGSSLESLVTRGWKGLHVIHEHYSFISSFVITCVLIKKTKFGNLCKVVDTYDVSLIRSTERSFFPWKQSVGIDIHLRIDKKRQTTNIDKKKKGGTKSTTGEQFANPPRWCSRSWDVSLINDHDTGYIYTDGERESTYRSKPSDALGSTPLTIRNITLGNLLSIAKSRGSASARTQGAAVASRTISPATIL